MQKTGVFVAVIEVVQRTARQCPRLDPERDFVGDGEVGVRLQQVVRGPRVGFAPEDGQLAQLQLLERIQGKRRRDGACEAQGWESRRTLGFVGDFVVVRPGWKVARQDLDLAGAAVWGTTAGVAFGWWWWS